MSKIELQAALNEIQTLRKMLLAREVKLEQREASVSVAEKTNNLSSSTFQSQNNQLQRLTDTVSILRKEKQNLKKSLDDANKVIEEKNLEIRRLKREVILKNSKSKHFQIDVISEEKLKKVKEPPRRTAPMDMNYDFADFLVKILIEFFSTAKWNMSDLTRVDDWLIQLSRKLVHFWRNMKLQNTSASKEFIQSTMLLALSLLDYYHNRSSSTFENRHMNYALNHMCSHGKDISIPDKKIKLKFLLSHAAISSTKSTHQILEILKHENFTEADDDVLLLILNSISFFTNKIVVNSLVRSLQAFDDCDRICLHKNGIKSAVRHFIKFGDLDDQKNKLFLKRLLYKADLKNDMAKEIHLLD